MNKSEYQFGKFTLGQIKFLEYCLETYHDDLSFRERSQIKNGINEGQYVITGKRSETYNKLRKLYLFEFSLKFGKKTIS